jgi:hypothetical protein
VTELTAYERAVRESDQYPEDAEARLLRDVLGRAVA